jgi:hypothetical protein
LGTKAGPKRKLPMLSCPNQGRVKDFYFLEWGLLKEYCLGVGVTKRTFFQVEEVNGLFTFISKANLQFKEIFFSF